MHRCRSLTDTQRQRLIALWSARKVLNMPGKSKPSTDEIKEIAEYIVGAADSESTPDHNDR